MASIIALAYDTVTGNFRAMRLGGDQLAPNAINRLTLIANGLFAATAEGRAKFASGIWTADYIAAAAIGTVHIDNTAVTTPKLADSAVTSAKVAAGSIGTGHLADNAVTAAKIAPNAVGATELANNAVNTAAIVDGAITEAKLVPGISIDIAETTRDPTFRAVEPIEAYAAVAFVASGFFGQANAFVPARMPAVGIATAAVASGAIGTFLGWGRISNPGWNFSGYIGDRVFVASGGAITRVAPSTSGSTVQSIGQIVTPDTIIAVPDAVMVLVSE